MAIPESQPMSTFKMKLNGQIIGSGNIAVSNASQVQEPVFMDLVL